MMTGAHGPVDTRVSLQHEAIHTLAARLAQGRVIGARAAVGLVQVVAGLRALGHALGVDRVVWTQGLHSGRKLVVERQSGAGPLGRHAHAEREHFSSVCFSFPAC